MSQKGQKLAGGSATLEVLESSRTVLSPGRNGQARGIQQFFTPRAVADWIASIVGAHRACFDPTAGDGSLLAGFDARRRYGVEIDPDQLRATKDSEHPYLGVQGDVQHLYPLLRRLSVAFPVVVCNPPFGLAWDVAGLGKGNSTLLTFQMAQGLLLRDGQGVLVAGRDRFDREVLATHPGAFDAIVDVAQLFPNVDLPCTIAFWRATEGAAGDGETLRLSVARADELDESIACQVRAARQRRAGYWMPSEADPDTGAKLDAAGAEYRRRRAEKEGTQAHTIALRGHRLSVRPSAFTLLTLAAEGRRDWLQSFDRQAPAYFALHGREWRRVLDAGGDRLRVAVGLRFVEPVLRARPAPFQHSARHGVRSGSRFRARPKGVSPRATRSATAPGASPTTRTRAPPWIGCRSSRQAR